MAIGKKHYEMEREGRIDFFQKYRIDHQGAGSILTDYVDGIYHGNLFVFKLNISNKGKVLFQAIKCLSKMRMKGESVPARILLIDLNKTKVYVYRSADYLKDIQKLYVGAVSKSNDAFSGDVTPVAEYDYMDLEDSAKVQDLLINKVAKESDWYVPIDLDGDCIVGWAERYYREIPDATKGDFLGDGTGKLNKNGEIRDPKHFVGLINPYKEATNERFKYLMDCLNDRLNKKDLGTFYTPVAYCEKAAELVQKAVARVPKGNDYIILDRCAGTGNLESALYGKYDKNGEELISHCVVSTIEYYEYKILMERIGLDVRNIIPPSETSVIYENGRIVNADAMSKEYVDNPLIRQYVEDSNCTIILFENPPYADSSASENAVEGDRTKKAKTDRKNTYVAEQFKENIKKFKTVQSSSRELSNLFIWSGFEYYLRQPTDSYVVFSPVKYFKSIGLVKKHFEEGFAFNRKFFHATESVISCVLWTNEDEENTKWELKAYDVVDSCLYDLKKTIQVKSVLLPPSKYADLRKFDSDVETNVSCASDGYPIPGYHYKAGRHPVYNDNIIGYMTAINFPINAVNYRLTRCNTKSELEQSFGFHLRKDVYLTKLPVWCAKLFDQENWYDRDVYFSTADGGNAFETDQGLLKACLIYTCLSNQNKCLSFKGEDGRFYRNELCFDATNGDTVACLDLAKMSLDDEEKNLMELWDSILKEAKKSENYQKNLTYGIYQITKELNTSHEEGKGKMKKTVYDYPNLNSYLVTLRDALKAYYKSHITEKLFYYELLK